MKFTFLANIALTDKATRQMLDNVEHLVVPAVAIREGVLNNIFYPASELATMVEAWNGVPVPVGHPTNDAGNPITANRTDVEESVNIGRFYNVMFHDNAIKGEIWLNIEKATRLGFATLIESLESGEMMEISTGLLADTKPESGTWGSTPYESIINGIRPDHLALLPDEIGACSIEQGCGAMRSNCQGDNCTCGGTCKSKPAMKKNAWQRFLGLFLKNSPSHDTIRGKLSSLLQTRYGTDPWPYIVDVFDTFVVYELGPDLYRESYHSENDGNEIVLEGEPSKVRVEVQYVPLLANQEINQMDPTKRSALVNALAVALVANVQGAVVTDEQKAGIASLSDDMLRNMAGQNGLNEDGTPKVAANAAPATPATPVQPVETPAVVPTVVNAGQQPVAIPQAAPAPVVNGGQQLSGDQLALLNRLVAQEGTRLANKRAQVVAGHAHLTDEIVANMDETALDALIGAIHGNQAPATPGIGAAGPVRNAAQKDYQPPSIILANTSGDGKGGNQ